MIKKVVLKMVAHLQDLLLAIKARRDLSGIGAHVAALLVLVEVVPLWSVLVVVFNQVFRGLHCKG